MQVVEANVKRTQHLPLFLVRRGHARLDEVYPSSEHTVKAIDKDVTDSSDGHDLLAAIA